MHGRRLFVCPVCQLPLGSKTSVMDHIKAIHHIGEPYKCDCGYVHWSRTTMSRHRKKCSDAKDNVSVPSMAARN